ncbi:MAG: glycosyl hydrolase 115 family protein [Sphingomonas sp.]
MARSALRLGAMLMAGALAGTAHAACTGPVAACGTAAPGALALLAPDTPATVVISARENEGVLRAAADLRHDIAAVSGVEPRSATFMPQQGDGTIIVGTLGTSPLIDALAKAGKIDLAGLKGQWEGYVEQVVDNPAPGVARALVIAGADRRGTIYGIYDISAKIGVSPWQWWADVPPQHHDRLWLTAGRVADHPVVKYRGIFLNDEDPALGGWAKTRFGGVNAQFYARLFPLMLRLKANFLWPAMWGKSLWDDDPLSAKIAKRDGVILGTSHHEPMGRAQIEWHRYGKGPWDYTTNAAELQKFWREGIERRGDAEDLVTVGMRGDGDKPMTQGTAIPLLEKIVADQRKIIADVTGKPADQTPQVWALYKEVQDYYDQGMRVPDDVTLLFSDDNWGNLRRLPKPGTKRPGGYGIYYHFDYVGAPRNYKWIDTNSMPRVWQQMEMAHAFGADRLWIVNVGDLKPMEYPLSFFLDLAWNPDRMSEQAMQAYPQQWAAQQFGPAHAAAIGELIARYGQLAARRKPELLDADTYRLDAGQWARVMQRWDTLEADARAIAPQLAPDQRDAYYELVLHRIAAFANLHRLYYAVARNHAEARAGDAAAAERDAEAARRYFAEDKAIRRRYEVDTAGGKWTDMMAQTHIGYTSWQEPPKDVMPTVWTVTEARAHPASTTPVCTPIARHDADDTAARLGGGGFTWQVVPRLGIGEAAMVASPVSGDPIVRPGGATPHLSYAFTTTFAGPMQIEVTAAPAIDVRGGHQQRFAVSIDNGAPQIVNLLADDSDKAWGRSVIEDRRVATATLSVAAPGTHRVSIWLVDPQVVFERVTVTPPTAACAATD